jgi:hypothetical protein
LLTSQSASWVSQPAIGGLGLVQLQLFLEKVAQAVEQLALPGVFRRRHSLGRITAQCLRHGCTVGLDDQFAQDACVLVLTGHHIEQCRPERRIVAEPIEDAPIK